MQIQSCRRISCAAWEAVPTRASTEDDAMTTPRVNTEAAAQQSHEDVGRGLEEAALGLRKCVRSTEEVLRVPRHAPNLVQPVIQAPIDANC